MKKHTITLAILLLIGLLMLWFGDSIIPLITGTARLLVVVLIGFIYIALTVSAFVAAWVSEW